MNKFICIPEFVQQLFSAKKTTQQASQIITGIMLARSPRLSDIATHLPGQSGDPTTDWHSTDIDRSH